MLTHAINKKERSASNPSVSIAQRAFLYLFQIENSFTTEVFLISSGTKFNYIRHKK